MKSALVFLIFALTLTCAEAQLVPGTTPFMDGTYTGINIVSTNKTTSPGGCQVVGPVTVGDVVGCDYSFTYLSTPYVRQFRHTMTGGDTPTTAMVDLVTQMQADTVLRAAVGYNIVDYWFVRNNCGPIYIEMFWSKTFFSTMFPVLAAYKNTGATETVNVTQGQGFYESNPYISMTHSTRADPDGREPMAMDAIGWIYFSGDATGVTSDPHYVKTLYGQMGARITDPNPDTCKARFDITFDTINLQTPHLLVNGLPPGPVGVQGPQGIPGGNIAGSIVQSPVLQIYADVTNAGSNFSSTRVYKLSGLTVTTWRTIATIIPSITVGSWADSLVKCDASSNTNGVGFGVSKVSWQLGVASGTIFANQLPDTVTYGSYPRMQIVSGGGNSMTVQISSPDSVNFIAGGVVECKYMLSDAQQVPGSPALTWTIN